MKDVTDASFNTEVLDHAGPVLVDIWAPWCGPCRAMEPWLQAAELHFGARVKIVKVNMDANAQVVRHFNVSSLPTLLLVRGGRLLARSGNPGSAVALVKFVEGNL